MLAAGHRWSALLVVLVAGAIGVSAVDQMKCGLSGHNCPSIIKCDPNDDCWIDCYASGCANRTVECPDGHSCNFNCHNPGSCVGARVSQSRGCCYSGTKVHCYVEGSCTDLDVRYPCGANCGFVCSGTDACEGVKCNCPESGACYCPK
mmetsp:Transcript_9589/g.33694  ORF Transcript_9589/g.33694 Transcript_9589/m.33694 type:complete len:148 (-) Transcript_9589:88-531(-)